MIQRRCPSCAIFYEKKIGDCPECGCPPGIYSKHLFTSKLNNHLYRQAEAGLAENKQYRAMLSGREPEPPKWARQKAKEIVANW